MKERQLKRLWEAQSIQRKLNEVDVKMFELEERAKVVERSLRDGNSKEIFMLFFSLMTFFFVFSLSGSLFFLNFFFQRKDFCIQIYSKVRKPLRNKTLKDIDIHKL